MTATTGAPSPAQMVATTNMGGLNARNDTGMYAKPAIGAGMVLPCATRITIPVISATVPTLMMFSGFGIRVRKNPLSTANVPASTIPHSLRTTAPAAYATPNPTRP
jgi:hypothetical protein